MTRVDAAIKQFTLNMSTMKKMLIDDVAKDGEQSKPCGETKLQVLLSKQT